jgi:hypothetical protein
MASNSVSDRRHPNEPGQRRASPPRNQTDQADDRSSFEYLSERATDYYERGENSLRECVSGREGGAVLLALASGVGVGLLIGAALGRSHRQSLSWHNRLTAEGFGRRLMERVENLIPEALAEHFPR